MVKIAVAGGSGWVAQEIINKLVATQKHEILIISRKDPPASAKVKAGVTWAKTDYSDKTQLTSLLSGVHTVLCFSAAHADPGSVAQKLLIDSAIAAGVKRYAPNEWSGSSIEELPWYAEKANVREYLKEINKDKKILEYTLFQPGFFVDMLVPLGNAATSRSQELWLDFPNRRAIALKNVDDAFTATTLDDLVNVVVRAIEYEGEWPVVGGIHGTTLSTSRLLEIGQKVRGGKPWGITYLSEADVRADNFDTPWVPQFIDPNLSAEQNAHFSKVILKGCLLSGVSRSWVVSDNWNRLLPDYKFTDAENFLEEHWAGKN
ncbi:NAD(P)-binding protein [Stipitochalara longipes BDJ]|nr:NAD(P)-binding protein [Stipitochalara longipes BDJ]